MNITQVKVFPVHEDKLKAFVSVVFDHAFMVNDIKVIQGKDGLFLSMPSRRKKNGEFKDVAHPLNNQTRRMLEERVLAEYRQVVDDPTPRRPDRHPSAFPAAAAASAPVAAEASRPEPTRHGSPRPEPVRSPPPIQPVKREENAARPAAEAAPSNEVVPAEPVNPGEKSLEEVQELHLRDSFWSVS